MQILLLRKRICMRACMYVRMYVCISGYVYIYVCIIYRYMGGCQDYGPFLGPYYNAAPSDLVFRVPKKGPLF